MNQNIVPNPQQSPVERQRQVIKTKTIGNTGSEIPDDGFRHKVAERKGKDQCENDNHDEKQAEKIKEEILKREGKMRHLKFEVIDEAAIVQVSVIDTEDGTVVRKVPSDEMVGLVKMLRENMKGSSTGLDIKA